MLTDPREAHADHNGFVHCLLGLVEVTRLVHALAADAGRRPTTPAEADDFVYLLVGVVRLGDAVGSLARPAAPQGPPADLPSRSTTPRELLR
jgi:hypothetical protein